MSLRLLNVWAGLFLLSIVGMAFGMLVAAAQDWLYL